MKTKTYEIDGLEYPSVTSILSIIDVGLAEWYSEVGTKEAKRISKEATDLGKELHSIIEHRIKKQEYKVPKGASYGLTNTVEVFERFLYERQPLFTHSEFPVFSKLWAYAGTCDAMGPYVVYDFKTSWKIGKIHWLQLAAYAAALSEMEIPIKEIAIVRLDKNLGLYEYEKIEWNLGDGLFDVFLSAKRLFDFFHTPVEPKRFTHLLPGGERSILSKDNNEKEHSNANKLVN